MHTHTHKHAYTIIQIHIVIYLCAPICLLSHFESASVILYSILYVILHLGAGICVLSAESEQASSLQYSQKQFAELLIVTQ